MFKIITSDSDCTFHLVALPKFALMNAINHFAKKVVMPVPIDVKSCKSDSLLLELVFSGAFMTFK